MEEKRSSSLPATPEPDLPSLQFYSSGIPVFHNATSPSFLSKLWRGRWVLLAFTLGALLIALMFGAVQLPLYRAQTSIELHSPEIYQPPDANTPNLSAPIEPFIQTQIRIIQSRSLLERVLSKLSDEERSRLVETPRFSWSRPSYDQNLESILHHISARPSEQAGIVDISFLSPDPVAGAHFLNSLTRELSDFNIERGWHAAQRSRQWTDRQLDELRSKWEQSELALAEYAQTSGIGPGGKIASPEISSPRLRPPPPSKQNLTEANDPKIRQLKDHLSELNKQIAQWQSLYGPSSPTVSNLKSEAASTETSLRQRRAALLHDSNSPDASYAVAESSPPPSLPQTRTVADRAQAMAHFNILKQEADSNRQVYEASASRLKEANVTSASHIGDISVVDAAIPPANPSTQGQLLNGSIGVLAGILLGIAFIGFRDRFSHTFADPALLGRHLSLDVLGAIPADRFREQAQEFAQLPDGPSLNLTFDTDPLTAEAYRSIRSSLLLKASEPSGPRRLVFTSAGSSEGKTSVVGNLGAALASAQRRVLLVDGDLRNPGLHKFFGADNDHGLADLLNHQLSPTPIATRDVIRATQVPDLYLLSAGQAGDRAPEILSSAQLPQLLREFAKGFDIVLIDSPPVLPYSDARSLARAADAVILIVKAGATNRRAALLARDAIAQDGSPLIGTILTEWDRSTA